MLRSSAYAALFAASFASLAQADEAWLAPCIEPQENVEAVRAAFVDLGWIEIAEGTAFDAAVGATGEVTSAMEGGMFFENASDAEEFLRGTHNRFERDARVNDNLWLMERDGSVLSIRIEEYRRVDLLFCILTGDGLSDMADRFNEIIPATRPIAQSVGVSRTRLELETPEGGVQPLSELVRIVYPEDLTAPYYAANAIRTTTNLPK